MGVEVCGTQVERDWRGGIDDREALALADLLGGLADGGLELGLLDGVDVVEHGLDRAELLDELHGCLLADAGDAGDVIGRIAFEGLEVRDLLGQDAVALEHVFGLGVDHGVALVGAVHPEVDLGCDELGDVAVHAHKVGVDALLRRLNGERAHEVVRLVALQLVDGDAERLDHLAGALHLAGELLALLVGHGDTRGFVSVGDLVSEGGTGGVEGDDYMCGFQLAEHV